jgi:hypothetical protein
MRPIIQVAFHHGLAFFLLVVCLLTPVVAWFVYDNNHDWTVAKLQRLIQSEIPPNSDRVQAEMWFERLGIHYFISDGSKGGGMVGKKTLIELAGLNADDISGIVIGQLKADRGSPRANLGWGRNGGITIYFFLDRQGRLAGHLVHPFVYSL